MIKFLAFISDVRKMSLFATHSSSAEDESLERELGCVYPIIMFLNFLNRAPCNVFCEIVDNHDFCGTVNDVNLISTYSFLREKVPDGDVSGIMSTGGATILF